MRCARFFFSKPFGFLKRKSTGDRALKNPLRRDFRCFTECFSRIWTNRNCIVTAFDSPFREVLASGLQHRRTRYSAFPSLDAWGQRPDTHHTAFGVLVAASRVEGTRPGCAR